MDGKHLKALVKEKYGEIAKQALQGCGCSETSCCEGTSGVSVFSGDYSQLQGYSRAADLKLGCGIPTEVAAIGPGDTVLDLGSGAGNDVFVARALTGESGQVIGLDLTEAMIDKARQNARTLGYSNVEFRLGDIESMPVDSSSIDVIISNCVLNLVPDKQKAFSEMYRVLKKGGHFSVSDLVLARPLPEELKKAAEMYAGCVSGAIPKKTYLGIIEEAGFTNVQVKIEQPVSLPVEMLSKFLSPLEIEQLQRTGSPVLSVTVYGEKA